MFQIILNSVISGLILSLVAIGFNYIFRVTKVFHIAHGGIYVLGTYLYFAFFSASHNYYISFFLSFLLVSLIIFLIEKVIYLPISKSNSNQTISLIASMGIYIIIVNIIAAIYGNENIIIRNQEVYIININFFSITTIQIIQFVFSIITIVFYIIFIKLTGSNNKLIAICDNEVVSMVYGININKERIKIFISGSILVCIASFLNSIDVGINPQSGMQIVLIAIVVSLLSSRLNVLVIVFISIVLTVLQNYVEYFLNAQWRDGITFLILLITILFKTEGLISYNLRKDNL
jgi:branched-chain amino acid transport system permease protein